jgi:hypothetical protein
MLIDLCSSCGQHPVKIKVWMLCSKCYQDFRKTSEFLIWRERSDADKLAEKKQKLIRKYGERLFADFDHLVKNPYPSLQTLADRYGLSRERIRQIYKMCYGVDWKSSVAARRSVEADIGCRYDPRQKLMEHEANIRRNSAKSMLRTHGEIALFDKCKELELSIEVTPGNQHLYHINSHPVLFHTSARSKPTNVYCANSMPYHRINTVSHGVSAEYLIVCLFPRKLFYIFPEEYWVNRPVLYIPHRESKYQGHVNDLNRRLVEYQERWDFLVAPYVPKVVPEVTLCVDELN